MVFPNMPELELPHAFPVYLHTLPEAAPASPLPDQALLWPNAIARVEALSPVAAQVEAGSAVVLQGPLASRLFQLLAT